MNDNRWATGLKFGGCLPWSVGGGLFWSAVTTVEAGELAAFKAPTVTSPAAQHGTLSVGSKSSLKPVSTQEALAIVGFLEGRKVLCTACGHQLADYETMWDRWCLTCVVAVQPELSKVKTNALERRLGQILNGWFGSTVPGPSEERQRTGDLTSGASYTGPQELHSSDLGTWSFTLG